jgi:hypothetical protein
MPVKTGTISSNDYQLSKDVVATLLPGETKIIEIDNYKRVQKYLYEIGLKMKPRREFSTKKLTDNSLRVTRVC